ncbi:MAG: hypothetical protein ABL885_06790 [Methylophilaceae bacterium]
MHSGKTTLLLITLLTALSAPAADTEEATAPQEEGFLGKLVGAVKKGVSDGIDNGIQSTGSVKVLGYTMMYSKLQRSNQPAFCLANADTGKLITVAPEFGTPYLRVDGTTGFTVMSQPVDKYHNKIEVNLTGVLPGLTCADLIAKHKLNAYAASTTGTGALSAVTMQSQGAGCIKPILSIPYTARMLCGTNMNDGIGSGVFDISTSQLVSFERGQCADYKGDIIPIGKACITMFTSFRTDGQPPTPTYAGGGSSRPAAAQAGWDKVDRIQLEGTARIEAESAARESANAEKSVMRKAAFEKCKPLINSDNSKMDAFKACFRDATR